MPGRGPPGERQDDAQEPVQIGLSPFTGTITPGNHAARIPQRRHRHLAGSAGITHWPQHTGDPRHDHLPRPATVPSRGGPHSKVAQRDGTGPTGSAPEPPFGAGWPAGFTSSWDAQFRVICAMVVISREVAGAPGPGPVLAAGGVPVMLAGAHPQRSRGRQEGWRAVSENRISLVRLDVPAAPLAEAIADAVRDWLLERGIVAANDRADPLWQPSAWKPGPRAREVADASWFGAFLGTANNGVDIATQRDCYHPVGNDEPPACRRCLVPAPPAYEEDYGEWVGIWLDDGTEPTFTCGYCGWTAPAGDWAGEFSVAVRAPAIRFPQLARTRRPVHHRCARQTRRPHRRSQKPLVTRQHAQPRRQRSMRIPPDASH